MDRFVIQEQTGVEKNSLLAIPRQEAEEDDTLGDLENHKEVSDKKLEEIPVQQRIQKTMQRFLEDPRFRILESIEEENLFFKNNLQHQKLDFTQQQKNQYQMEIAAKLMGKKMLGSYFIIGLLLGIILCVICVYFLSQVLSLIYVLIVSLSVFVLIAGIGFWTKKKIRKFKLLQFDGLLFNGFFKWV